MTAVVVRAPGQFGLEHVPRPAVQPGGILLKVLACGLCGSDLRTLHSGHHRVTLPWIIGHEVCGTVDELGADYAGPWRVGDTLALGPLAYCGRCDFCLDGQYELCDNYREIGQAWPGGLADYLAVPAECLASGTILAAPPGLDPSFAAITEPISSCVHAQEKGEVGLGDTVVIIGAGPVGCTHLSLARSRGASRVYIADITAQRLALCAAFQPDASIDASQTDLVAEVRRLTKGRGADVIVTATPAPIAQVQAIEMARKGGRVLLFGGLPADQSKPGVDMNIVHYNALHLIGTTTFAPRHQRIALDLVSSGRIPVDKLVTHRLPLAQFREGVALAMQGQALKIVFTP